MMQKIINFIKYHNAFTIIFAVIFFGGGIVFAASPEARDGVYAAKTSVTSVDNGAIVAADLDNFNFNLKINSVTEDEKNYYAAYSYQTLEIDDSVWQNKEINKTLTVGKEALDGRDLGLYVQKELGENINYELSYLKRVQKMEKEKGESQKVVTVEYSGLVGKLLDPKTMVIEGYEPVVPPPAPVVEAPPAEEQTPAPPAPSPEPPASPPQENPVPIIVPPPAEPQPEPPAVTTSSTSSEQASPPPEATSSPETNPPLVEASSTQTENIETGYVVAEPAPPAAETSSTTP